MVAQVDVRWAPTSMADGWYRPAGTAEYLCPTCGAIFIAAGGSVIRRRVTCPACGLTGMIAPNC
jgi:DNA-directed RNA polymerase subunit RPC12/RpoP